MDSFSEDGATPRRDEVDDEDDEGMASASALLSAARLVYCQANNNKKILFLLCIGLLDDSGVPIFDLDLNPWSKLKKRHIKPTRAEYANEVLRRDPTQKPANWTLERCKKFLMDNPLNNPHDVPFLSGEVSKLKVLLCAANQEQEDSSTSNWRGNLPYMRLVMCMTEDNVKVALRRSTNVMSRRELDARNSDSRQPTAFEIMADRWNDPLYNPVAPPSDVHIDFIDATDCSHSHVSSFIKATPSKIKDYFAAIRLGLLRIIRNWEQSGQGDGGHHGNDEEVDETSGDEEADIDQTSYVFGCLTDRPAYALSSRGAFLQGRPSYLLYFWEVADKHQLLQRTMNRLNDESGASDASSAPSVINVGARARRIERAEATKDTPTEDALVLSRSIQALADAEVLRMESDRKHEVLHIESDRKRQRLADNIENVRRLRSRIDQLQDQRREYRRFFAEAADQTSSVAQFYETEVNDIGQQITLLENEILSTPSHHNTTPP